MADSESERERDERVDNSPDNRPIAEPARRTMVEAMAPRLPQFWMDMPEAWFLQAESAFRSCSVRREQRKYDYIMQQLPAEAVKAVYDAVLKCQDIENPYTTLKTALISRYTISNTNRLEKLLAGTEMGDRTPSQYFTSLKLLAGNLSEINEQLLTSIWLRRLPPLVQVIAQEKSKAGVEIMLASADSAFEVYQRQNTSIFEMNSGMQQSASTSLENCLLNLEKSINAMEKKFTEMGNWNLRSRSRNRSGSRTRGNSKERSDFCFYHNRFGNKARKCRQPCNYKTTSTN